MTAEKKFSKKEDYRLSGKTFNVIVTHWHTDGYPDVGIAPEEHWCLYVVICNTHPLFKKACDNGEDHYGYDHGNEIYPDWHGGCTFYDKQQTYVKIGCDYQHIWDEQYWSCTEMPKDIENDARALFKFFEDAEQIEEGKLTKAKEIITALLNTFVYDLADEEIDAGQNDVKTKAKQFLKEVDE